MHHRRSVLRSSAMCAYSKYARPAHFLNTFSVYFQVFSLSLCVRQNREGTGRQTESGTPARRSGCQDAGAEGRGPAHQTGRPRQRASRTASEEPGPRTPSAGEKTTRTSAPATTARVRAASRARGGPGNDEAWRTTAEGQATRTAASTPDAQPTRTEPPAVRTAETTSATGNGEPCREPAKATTPERENGCGNSFCITIAPARERPTSGAQGRVPKGFAKRSEANPKARP